MPRTSGTARPSGTLPLKGNVMLCAHQLRRANKSTGNRSRCCTLTSLRCEGDSVCKAGRGHQTVRLCIKAHALGGLARARTESMSALHARRGSVSMSGSTAWLPASSCTAASKAAQHQCTPCTHQCALRASMHCPAHLIWRRVVRVVLVLPPCDAEPLRAHMAGQGWSRRRWVCGRRAWQTLPKNKPAALLNLRLVKTCAKQRTRFSTSATPRG